MTPPHGTLREVDYPESDGRPMAESDVHRDAMTEDVIGVLSDVFADRPDVYVSGNNFVYYVEGDTSKAVSPDGYVVLGVPRGERRVFRVWEEGRAPSFVIEVSSRKTRLRDLGAKMAIYRDDLGVREYFVFDPLGEWIPERLRGYTLSPGSSQVMPPLASGRLASAVLGLELGVAGRHVRFYRPGAQDPLPTRAERALAEARRADAAEAEVARLRAELERQRGSSTERSGPAPPS